MLLTPQFSLEQVETPSAFFTWQNEEFVLVVIHCPYVRVSDMDFFVEEREFSFFCNPYLLKLQLPGPCIEDDRCKAVYDVNQNNGTITVHLPKQNKGEEFPDLSLLTKMMVPRDSSAFPKKPSKALIEVLKSSEGEEKEEEEIEEEKEDAISLLRLQTDANVRYGFLDRFSNVFGAILETPDVLELEDPDATPALQRRSLRLLREDEKFDVESYLSDFLFGSEDPIYLSAKEFVPSFVTQRKELYLLQKSHCQSTGTSDVPESLFEYILRFSIEENDVLSHLPNMEFLLSSHERDDLLNDLFGVLCSYCYDMRTTAGEHSVESAWTICILSPLLSFLDHCQSFQDSCLSFLRRVCCYPYMRRRDLGLQCIQDALALFFCGRKIRGLLQSSEQKFIFNTLFTDQYLVWLQSLPSAALRHFYLRNKPQVERLQASEIGWDLETLEAEAIQLQREAPLNP